MHTNSSRRKFISTTVMAAGAMGMVPGALLANDSIQPTPFAQTPLPYAYNALEPYVDAMTMEIHHTKHAAAYTKNLNDAALAEFKGENLSLELVLSNISKYSAKLRNNSGGHYNHELFWKSMQATGTARRPFEASTDVQFQQL